MTIKLSDDDLKNSDVYVHFVDILFAVVLGQSFVLLSAKLGNWLVNLGSYLLQVLTMLLVYGLVITSWVGYHRSVKAYPIRNPLRFIVDIILLFLYYFAFVSVEDFGRVILLFLATFVAYVIWDFLRVTEYWSDSGNRTVIVKRCGVSVAFVVMLYLVWVLYPYMSAQSLLVGVLWLTILILLILYRSFKWKYETEFGRRGSGKVTDYSG